MTDTDLFNDDLEIRDGARSRAADPQRRAQDDASDTSFGGHHLRARDDRGRIIPPPRTDRSRPTSIFSPGRHSAPGEDTRRVLNLANTIDNNPRTGGEGTIIVRVGRLKNDYLSY